MTLESLIFMAISAGIGWAARHYGLLAPAVSSPQTQPPVGGTVPPPGMLSDLPSLLSSIVSMEMKKVVAYLDGRLPPATPPTT